jgi:hypothetical protein
MSEPPIKRVSADELRKLFNNSGYWNQYQGGQLQSILRKSKHPSSPLANEPICTQSQYITYVNESGEKIAGVHQYLRPDGTIGLSGKPDPKEVLIDGVLYIIETKIDISIETKTDEPSSTN